MQYTLFNIECEHNRVRFDDYGVCSETGYHDAGYTCLECGEHLDEPAPAPKKKPVVSSCIPMWDKWEIEVCASCSKPVRVEGAMKTGDGRYYHSSCPKPERKAG